MTREVIVFMGVGCSAGDAHDWHCSGTCWPWGGLRCKAGHTVATLDRSPVMRAGRGRRGRQRGQLPGSGCSSGQVVEGSSGRPDEPGLTLPQKKAGAEAGRTLIKTFNKKSVIETTNLFRIRVIYQEINIF